MDNHSKELMGKPEVREQDTQATYQIGKTKVLVTRIFQTKSAETLNRILVKLIKYELEKP